MSDKGGIVKSKASACMCRCDMTDEGDERLGNDHN